MKKYVIDTQALIMFMNGVKVISTAVDQILKKADAAGWSMHSTALPDRQANTGRDCDCGGGEIV